MLEITLPFLRYVKKHVLSYTEKILYPLYKIRNFDKTQLDDNFQVIFEQ
jgi:hypothetical protein